MMKFCWFINVGLPQSTITRRADVVNTEENAAVSDIKPTSGRWSAAHRPDVGNDVGPTM